MFHSLQVPQVSVHRVAVPRVTVPILRVPVLQVTVPQAQVLVHRVQVPRSQVRVSVPRVPRVFQALTQVVSALAHRVRRVVVQAAQAPAVHQAPNQVHQVARSVGSREPSVSLQLYLIGSIGVPVLLWSLILGVGKRRHQMLVGLIGRTQRTMRSLQGLYIDMYSTDSMLGYHRMYESLEIDQNCLSLFTSSLF